MNRDNYLIYKILEFSKNNYIPGRPSVSVKIDGYDEGAIREHLRLMEAEGLLEKIVPGYGMDVIVKNSNQIKGLTPEGEERYIELHETYGITTN